jgi:hypothetical protein
MFVYACRSEVGVALESLERQGELLLNEYAWRAAPLLALSQHSSDEHFNCYLSVVPQSAVHHSTTSRSDTDEHIHEEQ